MKLFSIKTAVAVAVITIGTLFGFAPSAYAQHYHGDLTHFSRISRHIRPGRHFNIYRIYMQGGCGYHISLNSRDFDPYLYVLNNNGRVLRQNDDGGPGLNSALTFYPPCNGWYEIMVTTFGQDRTGHYHLDVHRHSSSGIYSSGVLLGR